MARWSGPDSHGRRRSAWLLLVIIAVVTPVVAHALPAGSQRQGAPPEGPEANLPANIKRVTAFGERASWSPGGRRIAFISESFGDAMEVNLESGRRRTLTDHFPHAGFLRVQYLPNGDYLLTGARTFEDIVTTRSNDQELWVLDASARHRPVALHQKVFEGVAVSRRRLRIAWVETANQYPDRIAPGVSVIVMADVRYRDGRPRLVHRREVMRATAPDCQLEPQDFRDNDRELLFTCYGTTAEVRGIDLRTDRVRRYRAVPGEYNEAEGVSPDGRFILVESSRGQGGPERQNGAHIDIWKLNLPPAGAGFTRLTRWGDYEGYKASNPVVSPDGRRVAFQSARSAEPAGVGHGILVLTLPSRSGR